MMGRGGGHGIMSSMRRGGDYILFVRRLMYYPPVPSPPPFTTHSCLDAIIQLQGMVNDIIVAMRSRSEGVCVPRAAELAPLRLTGVGEARCPRFFSNKNMGGAQQLQPGTREIWRARYFCLGSLH